MFWLNAFPHPNGVSTTQSPRQLITGRRLDYCKHVRLKFGSYVQTHEKHTNDMHPHTVGTICLGPSGNEQGGHYFMSLTTGRRLHKYHWTALPMWMDAIARVNAMGQEQQCPRHWRFGIDMG